MNDVVGAYYEIEMVRTITSTAKMTVFIPDGVKTNEGHHAIAGAWADAMDLWGPGEVSQRVTSLSKKERAVQMDAARASRMSDALWEKR